MRTDTNSVAVFAARQWMGFHDSIPLDIVKVFASQQEKKGKRQQISDGPYSPFSIKSFSEPELFLGEPANQK